MNPHGPDPLDRVFRESYGKLLAVLLQRGFPLNLSEDAIAAAFESAAKTWNLNPPQNPEAWLLTVAIRKAIDERRKAAPLQPESTRPESAAPMPELETIPDERLRLYYLCTHPAIDPDAQTALMLQLILGFTAAEIATLFLVKDTQISQTLVRAKRKIRDAAIPLTLPGPDDLVPRTDAVLETVYALYSRAWELPQDPERRSLAQEAQDLARILVSLVPDLPEPRALLALVLFCECRRKTRRDPHGNFVPLDRQNPADWDQSQIQEAELLLHQAAQTRSPARFQLEAAIQSAHINRLQTGEPPWPVIVRLYEALLQHAPTAGHQIGHLAALAQAGSPQTALEKLNQLQLPDYQPYWTLKAHLHTQLNQPQKAKSAAQHAKTLTYDPTVAEFLAQTYGLSD